jgi:hypothetical protein
MASIITALETMAAKGWWKEWRNPAWKQFVLTGDEKQLKKLPKFSDHSWVPSELLSALPAPSQIEEQGRRFLKACFVAEHPQALGNWIQQCTMQDGADADEFSKACTLLLEIGCSKLFLAEQVALYVRPLCEESNAPTPAGEFLLALDQNTLRDLLSKISRSEHAVHMSRLFMPNAPQKWKDLAAQSDLKHLHAGTWVVALCFAPQDFLPLAVRAFDEVEGWYSQFEIGSKLHELDPARFESAMVELTSRQLLVEDSMAGIRVWQQAKQAACWLLANLGEAAVALLEKYFAAPLDGNQWHRRGQTDYKNEVLLQAVQKLGRGALPLLEACFATDQAEVQLNALQLWSGIKADADIPGIAAKLRQLFGLKEAAIVARAVRFAGDLSPEAVEEVLWPLLSHKSRPVRDAAASTLARLGESRLGKSEELWAARKADTRIAAVAWLKALGTEKAVTVLSARLEEEEDDNVRDAVLLALEKLQGSAKTGDESELRKRIKKTLSKTDKSPVPWLDPKKLPPCELKDGSKLSSDWLTYLLWRQSRVKEMRADIEAKPLYAQIDRKTSGELGLSVLHAFFGSKSEADDRWTMAFAALIGDDRMVPAFTHQIREWADNMRGKLAEYAVQALALMGTDSALLAVDAMAIRYRSKNKNIGKAATEAFAEAARARGLTVEELGDLVVPWLGFQPGQSRVVDAGKTKLEVRIDQAFKLTFRDAATKKKVAKLPESAPSELKAEFKEISASLKEAVKSQLLRMETLMVRQFRWPGARWQELYLGHPLLLPFAQRLVWGAYQPDGKLAATFRALEDHSLTDSGDEVFTLPPEYMVGIVHPLELSLQDRQGWLKHLADYDVVPPFAQLERSVVTVKPEQHQTKFGTEVAETELNAMTFKGRAERLGWTRGSVCDGGSINYYMKTFPGAGVDVFVETEGMYVGIDMYTDIELGRNFFVKHGSVQIGSYIYDEPSDPKDPRLLSYAEVPAIAYSEAMGDLLRISAKSTPQPAEAANA